MSKIFQPVVIIPHYNHASTIRRVVEELRLHNLPVIIVDDGSEPAQAQVVQQLQDLHVQVQLNPVNQGKGAAVKDAFVLAQQLGYSHVLQVDADGQHKLSDVLKFIQSAQSHPDTIICGLPVYGADAPKARLYGRKITNFWNAINTWSFDLKDGMCGFRLYPLDTTLPILLEQHIGNRMDFDTEILVRCHWQQIPFLWIETPVTYHPGGVSHFKAWADNWRISKMHARLFFGMLARKLTGKSV
ncbi:glycosyltransferase family 2 protein [Psittacicella hinzii]|uniref:Glycosyl transferase n=1 Tax=Psittacicella hinzii TaxID=2028575 RepID=A0A3A1YTI5_9GAMM|nr:glycosyltransferase family 2 protein [Psittacicella hinzii]RIY39714.1 glycosyl transferase [Psittacicella hinzii]